LALPHAVLIVGAGNIAGGFDSARDREALPLTHAGAFSRHPAFSIMACIEPDETRGRAFAAHWGIPSLFSGFDQIDPPPGGFDVVSICSPTAAHVSDIEHALTLEPRLIFCEKPITTDIAQARRAVLLCEQAGVVLMVNHTRRWAPDVQKLRQEIVDGAWGAARSATGFYNKGILNNGSHMLDLLHYLVGELTPLWAGAPIWDHWPDDPSMPAALAGPGSLPIMLNVADARDYAFFELELVFEHAVIRMESGGSSWRVRRSVDSATFAGYKALEGGQVRAGQYDLAMTNAIAEIAGVLATGDTPASTGKTALAAQELCNRIRQLSKAPAE